MAREDKYLSHLFYTVAKYVETSIQTRMTSKLNSSSDSYFLFEIHHDFIDTNSTVSYNSIAPPALAWFKQQL